MSLKMGWAYLASSLVIHGSLAFPLLSLPRQQMSGPQIEPVVISYIESLPSRNIEPLKEVMRIDPSPQSQSVKAKSEAVSIGDELRDQKKAVPRRKEKPGVSSPAKTPPTPGLSSSRELLSDPQKGRLFQGYFESVKQRINKIVKRNYDPVIGKGVVELIFILRSDGSLENAFVMDQNSKATVAVKYFALRSVTQSAPYPRFPKELPQKRISFNVTLILNES